MTTSPHLEPISPPRRLVAEQTGTMKAMLAGAARSLLPFREPPRSARVLTDEQPSPSPLLLRSYSAWCGAEGRYVGVIPPHLVSAKVALPLVSTLTARSRYPMLSVLNQGVRLRVHAPMPTDEPIRLSGELVEAADDGYRARIHSRVEAGTASVPRALTIDAMAAVMLKKRPAGDGAPSRAEPDYETIAEWRAAADEGRKFFLLTGDFNPIHTLPAVARRTRFGGCIMHGYGAFAQIFEAIERSGAAIADIDVRFVRPLPLPSPRLFIQNARTADAEGSFAFRLVDADANLYQVGTFAPREARR